MNNIQGKKVSTTWGVVGSAPPLVLNFGAGNKKGAKNEKQGKENKGSE